MKKTLLGLLCLALSCLSVYGQTEIDCSVGAEVVSNYIWRGMDLGGLSFQPDVTLGLEGKFGRFELDLWGNIGGANDPGEDNGSHFGFGKDAYFNPELDVTLSYGIGGFKVGATHYHYFDRSWFELGNVAREDLIPSVGEEDLIVSGDEGNQLEVFAQYTISEEIPLTIGWYTVVAGADGYLNSKAELKRAFSSYVELGYEFELPAELSLTAQVGFAPWRSMYTGYESKFVCNNLSARLEREWNLGEVASLTAFAQPMFNFYDSGNFAYGRNFMWSVGCGIWL